MTIFSRICLLAICVAMLLPLAVRAAQDDDEENVDDRIRAARKAREAKAKMTESQPKDPALPKDANDPIDLSKFLGGGEPEKDKGDKKDTPPAKEKDPSTGTGVDLSKFTGGDKKPDGAKDKIPPANAKDKVPVAPPTAPAAKDKDKTSPGKDAAGKDAIDLNKFGPNAGNANVPNAGAAGKGVCQACQGQKIVPILPYKPFIKIHDSDPANNPELAPAWRPCPICSAKTDIKEFLTEMKSHQDAAAAKNKPIEEICGKKLLQAENPYVAIRTMLTARELRKIMERIEKLSGHLEDKFKTMTLMTARPDDASIVMLTDPKAFDKVVDRLPDGEQKDFSKKVGSCTFEGNHYTRLDAMDTMYESHAIFGYASILIHSATNGNSPNWLTEGFCDYCEWSVLNSNHNYSIAYIAEHRVKFGTNWVADIRKLAQQGKLSAYNDMLHFDMIGMKQQEYLTCMGVVVFLIKSDPHRFDQMIQFIRDGEDAATAMEKAYGRKMPEMEKIWKQWLAMPQW